MPRMFLKLGAIWIVVSVLFANALQAKADERDDLLAEALNKLAESNHDSDEVTNVPNEAIATGITPEFLVGHAELNLMLGLDEQALEVAEQALRKDPGHIGAKIVRAKALMYSGKFKDGTQELEQLYAGVQDESAGLALCAGYAYKGQHLSAMEVCSQLIQTTSDTCVYWEALNRRIKSYVALGMDDAAERDQLAIDNIGSLSCSMVDRVR
jgi:tetratricopeptide (TPR) repeat protein